MDNAVVALAAIENEAAVQEGLAHYISQMKQLKFPVDQEELSEKHGESMAGALGVFMDRSFKDEGQKYLQKLKVTVQASLFCLCFPAGFHPPWHRPFELVLLCLHVKCSSWGSIFCFHNISPIQSSP